MKFEYDNIEDNFKNTVLIVPPWDEMKDVIVSSNLKIINPKDKKYFTYRKDETTVGALFSNDLIYENTQLYEEAYRLILSDYRWVMLCERRWINSATNYLVKIRELVIGCVNYIKKNDIKFIFNVTVPHAIETWVLSKILEEIFSGTSFIFCWSQIPGFSSLYKGIDKFIQLDLDERFNTEDLKENFHSREYIELCKSSSSNKKDKKWLLELNALNKWKINKPRQIPQRIIQKVYKNYIFNKYKKHSFKGDLISKNNVVYFMHYQPEATTLPLGQFFVEQSNAINTLRMAFPKETKIYIKEHPTQFKQPIDPRFRPGNYYDLINSMENVEFINPMYSSFNLIDQAKFVSTLNGKVSFQSLLRGKPIILFGLNKYNNHEGCHFYKDQKNLRNFINNSHKINFEEANDKFISSLKNKCVNGYVYKNGKLLKIGGSTYNKARRVGIMKMINSIFA